MLDVLVGDRGFGLVSDSYMCGGVGDEGEGELVDGVCASCGWVDVLCEDLWLRMVCFDCGSCNL